MSEVELRETAAKAVEFLKQLYEDYQQLEKEYNRLKMDHDRLKQHKPKQRDSPRRMPIIRRIMNVPNSTLKVAHDCAGCGLCSKPKPVTAPSKQGGVQIDHCLDSPGSLEDEVGVFLYGREYLRGKRRKARDSLKRIDSESRLVNNKLSVGQWNSDTKRWEK